MCQTCMNLIFLMFLKIRSIWRELSKRKRNLIVKTWRFRKFLLVSWKRMPSSTRFWGMQSQRRRAIKMWNWMYLLLSLLIHHRSLTNSQYNRETFNKLFGHMSFPPAFSKKRTKISFLLRYKFLTWEISKKIKTLYLMFLRKRSILMKDFLFKKVIKDS